MFYGRTIRCPFCGFRRPVDGEVCPTCHSVGKVVEVELTRTQQAWLFVVVAVLFVGVVAVLISDNCFGTDFLESAKGFFTKSRHP